MKIENLYCVVITDDMGAETLFGMTLTSNPGGMKYMQCASSKLENAEKMLQVAHKQCKGQVMQESGRPIRRVEIRKFVRSVIEQGMKCAIV